MEKKIEKLKTEMSEIYGERLAFDHWEELEYSVIDEIGLKLNEIIDYLNSQEQELDKAREEVQFTKEELECILKWKDACDGEFNGMTLLPASGEDWGKEEDIESAEDKLEEMLSKLKDNK